MEVRSIRLNKAQYFSSGSRVNTAVWMLHIDADKAYGEKTWRQLHKNAASCIEQILKAASHKAADVWTPMSHLQNHPD